MLGRGLDDVNKALTVEDHDVIIYARVTLGYYTYASAVAEIIIPLKEFQELSGLYTATIRIFPDNRFDIWGVQDPRVYKIEGLLFSSTYPRALSSTSALKPSSSMRSFIFFIKSFLSS